MTKEEAMEILGIERILDVDLDDWSVFVEVMQDVCAS